MDLVVTAQGYLISILGVAKDFHHVIGLHAGLDVNPFQIILPQAPNKSTLTGMYGPPQ